MKEKLKLNDNDKKLLAYCMGIPKSVSMIAKHLDIAPKNVSVRLKKLKDNKFIEIESRGKGRKTLIKTIQTKNSLNHRFNILDTISKKGAVIDSEYFSILPRSYEMSADDYDKDREIFSVYFSDLIEKKISLTEKGINTLKDLKERFKNKVEAK